jgi:hypothetical protein
VYKKLVRQVNTPGHLRKGLQTCLYKHVPAHLSHPY